jgi:DNA-binding response OmpR family regulator
MPRILVIDDEQPNIDLLRMALTRKGFEVIGATAGLEGLVLAQIEQPDAIILDMMLPDIGGEELCRQFRQIPAISRLPILVLTARQSTSGDVEQMLLAGATGYLTKPANFIELAAQLNSLIAASRASVSS